MRVATLSIMLVLAIAACNDLRDFQGEWSGARAGDAPALKVGVAADAEATLAIDAIDTHGLRGQLAVTSLFDTTPLSSLEGAEADALATMSFAGAPMRVYLAFVPATAGDILAIVALFDSRRIELRLIRGGGAPVYAIFALSERG